MRAIKTLLISSKITPYSKFNDAQQIAKSRTRPISEQEQQWLADQMGLNYNTVNGWCNNRNQPYLSDLVKVAGLLEVAPADLITDGTKKEKGLSETQTLLKLA